MEKGRNLRMESQDPLLCRVQMKQEDPAKETDVGVLEIKEANRESQCPGSQEAKGFKKETVFLAVPMLLRNAEEKI